MHPAHVRDAGVRDEEHADTAVHGACRYRWGEQLLSMPLRIRARRSLPCLEPGREPVSHVPELLADTSPRGSGARAGDELKVDGDVGAVR